MRNQLVNLTIAIALLITSFSCQENEEALIKPNKELNHQLVLLNNKTLISTPLEGDKIINFQIDSI